jgi:hypothetical protein
MASHNLTDTGNSVGFILILVIKWRAWRTAEICYTEKAMEKRLWVVLGILGSLVALAIAATAWTFLYKEDYTFRLEAACDPSTERCFVRDCSNADDCPANGLENYKVFTVHAYDFERCQDNSCLAECTSGSISCDVEYCEESGEEGEGSCDLTEPPSSE